MMKKDKTLLILGAFVMFFGVGYFLYGVIDSWVMGDREAVYETYTVKRGDTFWGISERYRDRDCRDVYIMQYKYELEKLNPEVKPGELKAGDKLKVRYYIKK